MLNIARTGTALVTGAISGGIEPVTKPLMLGTTAVSYGTVVEALALVVGAGLQFMSPYTMPDVADGLVDGSVALLAHRGTKYAIAKTQTAAAWSYPHALNGAGRAAMYGGVRGQIGSVGNVPKRTLT